MALQERLFGILISYSICAIALPNHDVSNCETAEGICSVKYASYTNDGYVK